MTASMPISSVVSTRYAQALLDLADEAKSVSKIEKNIESLEAMIKESPEFVELLNSPLIGEKDQLAAVSEVAKKAKFEKLTADFLGVLVENRRLNALEGIVGAFKKQMAKRSGQIEVRVETAEKMTAAQEKDVNKKISVALGADVIVEAHVNPEILGGMIVTIGSYMVDDSVRRKLERLNVALKSNSNQNTANLKEVV